MAIKKEPILSAQNLMVKFKVRDRILTAVRNVSLDLNENETLAIVGESGSGKSVLTKTFTGMLDSNGYIDEGHIIFNGQDLTEQRLGENPRYSDCCDFPGSNDIFEPNSYDWITDYGSD